MAKYKKMDKAIKSKWIQCLLTPKKYVKIEGDLSRGDGKHFCVMGVLGGPVLQDEGVLEGMKYKGELPLNLLKKAGVSPAVQAKLITLNDDGDYKERSDDPEDFDYKRYKFEDLAKWIGDNL